MKTVSDFMVCSCEPLNERISLLKLRPMDGEELPKMQPGQFVEVLLNDVPSAFLRRPISIHYVDRANNHLWLLVQNVGAATDRLTSMRPGEQLNLVYPLGNGFKIPRRGKRKSYLLVGGGVGVAPLLYLGARICEEGHDVTFLLGARTQQDLVQLKEFDRYGRVFTMTENGTHPNGDFDCRQGLVTDHRLWWCDPKDEQDSEVYGAPYDRVYVCGPKPMMKAVAALVRRQFQERGREVPKDYCEVSLENKMACGLGVCLCCVEDTREGHRCVCSDGPVFDINDLKWE
jgi:dihydroorotate dehydrogenase electron transfer subunit